MAYLGNDLQVAFPTYRNIDDISGSFNGVTTSFPLTVAGVAPIPAPINSQQCLISVNGVVQRPDDSGTEGFRLSGGNIIFASAPAGGVDFFGVILAGADYVNIGANFPSGTAVAPSITFDSDLDTGIYNPAGNQIGFTTSGVQRLVINSSGQISGGLGTAAAPVISFISDPNTGIYSPGADQVAISTGGSGRLFVDASGNVGVATGAPSYRLEVNGTISQSSQGTSSALIQAVNAGGIFYHGLDNSVGTTFGHAYAAALWHSGAYPILFATNGSERLRITSAGLVGIGTSSPSGLLHVTGQIYSSGTGYTGTNSPTLRLINSTATTGRTFGINSADAGAFQVFDASAGDATRLWLDSSGRVGIGATNPLTKLDVRSGVITAGSNSSPYGTEILRGYYSDTDGALAVIGTEYSSGGTVIGNAVKPSTSASGAFLSSTNINISRGAYTIAGNTHKWYIGAAQTATENSSVATSEVMCIDSSGRLLVGTSSSSAEAKFIVQGGATAAGGAINIQRNATTASAGSTIGFINFTNSANNVGATISADGDGTWSAGTSHPTRLVFSTTADGASSPTERMRINKNGEILFGTSTTTNGCKLALVNTDATRKWGFGTIGTNTYFAVVDDTSGAGVQLNAGSTSWSTFSDERLKDNLAPIQDGLDKVSQLRAVTGRYKTDDINVSRSFLIAQDVQAVLPEAVDIMSDDMRTLSLKYTEVIPLLVSALKESKERIETLEAKVAALESA